MIDFLRGLLTADFMPHGHCYLWRPEVLWMHVVSDLAIALAYFSIPVSLIYFVQRRRDVAFGGMGLMFGAFICACGLTHLLEVVTAWNPVYRLAGVVKVITAVISLITAGALWQLLPRALLLPSVAQLAAANSELQEQIARRTAAEDELRRAHDELDARVAERTAELARANEELRVEIFERERAERELRDRQQQFQALLDHSPTIIYLKELDGRVKLANREFARLYGTSPEAFIGKTARDFLPAHLAEQRDRTDRAMLQSRRPVELEEEVPLPEGARTFRMVKFPLLTDSGAPYAYCGIGCDVTDQKRVENELRLAKDQAEKASLAKSEFLSRVSHELRTPLNAILGFGQLLDMDQDLNPAHRLSVGQILAGGRHLLDLVNEVLELSIIESGRMTISPETLSVEEALREVCHLAQPMAREQQVELEHIVRPEGWHVRADRQRLKQVLLNLMANGIRYNHRGGRVTLQARPAPGNSPEPRLRITVADTGPGIAAELLPRLFTPFDRLGAERSGVDGAGLGLALSRRMAELMGGTLSVQSEPGKGCEFTLELPLAETPRLTLEPTTAAPSSLLEGSTDRTVLYIDDNAVNVRLVEEVFSRRTNVKLISTMDGRTGLELARLHRPELILLDLHLPDVHGIDVLESLRAATDTRDIPVAVVTADASKGERERMLAAGACAYITKPFDIPELLRMADGLLAKRES